MTKVESPHEHRERLIREFTAGKKYRAYKMKIMVDENCDFEILLELEKEGLLERHTHSEEHKETVIFTWIGPK